MAYQHTRVHVKTVYVSIRGYIRYNIIKPQKAMLSYAHAQQIVIGTQKAGDLTATQWQQIVELFEHTCAYCGSVEKLSIEHIVPVSHGGQLTKSNIIVACQHCNSSRGNKDIYKWLDTIAPERKEKILWYMNEGYKTIE